MNSRRVAFVLYNYPLGVSTMVVNSILMFAAKGYQVDLIIDREYLEAGPIAIDDPRIRFVVYSGNRSVLLRLAQFAADRLNSVVSPPLGLAANGSFEAALALINPMMFVFSRWLKKVLSSHEYTFIIPIEYRSLLSLHAIGDRSKIVYYNMELLDWREDNPLYRNKTFWKHLESRMIATLDHVAIQSPGRAELFVGINDFDPAKIHLLPVASMGDPVEKKSTFFSDRCGIPAGQTIVVYSGSFTDWAYCLEIIESVKSWPANFSLVMHTWNQASLKTRYFAGMKRAARGLPVYFSTQYIEADSLAEALSSADIGLMFYRPIDGNFTEILYSSNKMGEYLKAGLPVVCSDYPTLKEFVVDHGVGVALTSFDAMSRALQQMQGEIRDLRARALHCYRTSFRFEAFFNTFYRELDPGEADL